MQACSKVFIVVGPTASGKSAYALELAALHNGEIVNADTAQMYTRVSVGTAKPLNWQSEVIPHHLFDICDAPAHFDVVRYRQVVIDIVDAIHQRGKTAVIVGGSLFYVKSLFFPPQETAGSTRAGALPPEVEALDAHGLWQHLAAIDPQRAAALHEHDVYRVRRALAIWYHSGQLPSSLVPVYDPPFQATLIALMLDKAVLHKRIAQRTAVMIEQDGWVAEVESLLQDPAWYELVCSKGFIGYRDIGDWILGGKKADALSAVAQAIVVATCQYAKQQHTLWQSFARQLRAQGERAPQIIETPGPIAPPALSEKKQ